MPPALTAGSSRVAAARRLLHRKYRVAQGQFLVEGPLAVREAVAAGAVHQVFLTEQAAARWAADVAAAGAGGAGIWTATPQALASLSQTEAPQGIVAVCRWASPTLADVLQRRPRLGLLLHEVADPGNAGSAIRVADAAGAGFVALSDASVDPTNGKCVRACTGSLFHLPVVAAGPTAVALRATRSAGMRVLAADVSAAAVDLFRAEAAGMLDGPTAWLFGNEAHGLPDPLLDDVDAVVRIPILGRAESLNLATAVAVCLYASARRMLTDEASAGPAAQPPVRPAPTRPTSR